MGDRTLQVEFDSLDGARQNMLSRARECSELSLPNVLPRKDMTKDEDIRRPYTSLGAYGSTNMVNKLLLALYPIGVPWFRCAPGAKVRNNTKATPEAMDVLDAALYLRELLVREQLEEARIRVRKRACLESLIVVGNTLSALTDNYRLKVFRLDQYVQKRASDGDWLYVITHEKVVPSQLSDTQIANAGLNRKELEQRGYDDEGIDLFTKCKRERYGGFVVRQEINGKVVAESEERVSPYFPSGYAELPGEDYSRGFIEERAGALRSLNGLTKAILDASVASSKILWGIDPNITEAQPRDLLKDSGSIISGVSIAEGKWRGVACLQADKFADMQIAFAAAKQTYDELSTQMLIESAVQPEGERVTAYQVNRIARELEGATGGIYIHVAEEEQRPLVERMIFQMQRDKLLPTLPKILDDQIEIEIITGAEALSRQRDAEKIQALIPLLQAMPNLMPYIKERWILNTAIRGLSIDERTAIKSVEEVEAEQAQAAELQAKMAMAQQAIQTGGKVVENESKPQATRTAAAM